jgi:predicted HicB family RNase H-like nuclease
MNPQKMYSDTNITIRVNKEVKRAIKQEAARRGVTLSAFLLVLANAALNPAYLQQLADTVHSFNSLTQPQQ